MLIPVKASVQMNQVPVAVNTLFFISFPGIQNCLVGQHGSPFVRDVEQVPVAFLALGIFKGFIGILPAFFPVIRTVYKVDKNIFKTVIGFGIKEIKRILGRRQVTVHAVRDKSLGIIDMGRGFPAVVGRLDFMARGTESRGRCPNHGIIGQAENGKCNQDAYGDPKKWLDDFFHTSNTK